MNQHIHVNFLEFIIFGAMLMVWNFLLRSYAAWRSDHADGKAIGAFA